ncbi:MAG: POT family proton-dependent oligopeptide transporter, partial [Sphingobacteriales bacterium]
LFTGIDKILMVLVSILGLLWIINDPLDKIADKGYLNFNIAGIDASNVIIIGALILFLYLIISRTIRYSLVVRDRIIAVAIFAFFTVFFWAAFEQAGGSMSIFARDYTDRLLDGSAAMGFKIFNTLLTIVPMGIITYVLILLFKQTFEKYALGNVFLAFSFVLIWGIVIWMLVREFNAETAEVNASWFGILNSFFIIAFAPLFSKIWESKYNPPAAVKYGLGLILLGLGFGALAFGASTIQSGAETASVSMIWLVFAYLFHTLGELCLSPVGLSYVSKLVPGRMIGMMYGIWYLAIAIGNKTAGTIGGMIDEITAHHSMAFFFLLFTIIPAAAGLVCIGLNPVFKRLMHGIK